MPDQVFIVATPVMRVLVNVYDRLRGLRGNGGKRGETARAGKKASTRKIFRHGKSGAASEKFFADDGNRPAVKKDKHCARNKNNHCQREEFAVIAPQCGHEGAVALAERLRRAVKGTQIEWRGSPLSLTVSIGGAICTGAGSQRSPSEMIEAADRLLYAAKDAGRDRCFLEPLPSVTTGTIASINVPETTG